jgi:hypothetical protein
LLHENRHWLEIINTVFIFSSQNQKGSNVANASYLTRQPCRPILPFYRFELFFMTPGLELFEDLHHMVVLHLLKNKEIKSERPHQGNEHCHNCQGDRHQPGPELEIIPGLI